MTREDIERASKEEIKLAGSPSALGSTIKKFCRESFICGAEWRINSVWHKPNKGEPDLYLMLIEFNDGTLDLGYEYNPEKIKRWAYIKDLLPIKEE